MREINLNGYIDDEVWFGDEVTPDELHDSLYGPDNKNIDDAHIRLNSYGGSCNAATRMFDDIRAYPGNVYITISGTAASAATVLSMAATRLEMTPGSLYMIHDPITGAWGNERDMLNAVDLLRACKESIINVYATRCRRSRGEVSDMMTATTWMDAKAALEMGFIDAIVEDKNGGLTNAAKHQVVDRAEAEAKVKAWYDRQKPSRPVKDEVRPPDDDHTSTVKPVDEQAQKPEKPGETAQAEVIEPSEPPEATGTTASSESTDTAPPEATGTTAPPESTGTPIAQLEKRLGLIMPTRR